MPGSINFDEMKIKEQGIQARNIQKLEQSGKVNFNSLEIKRSRSQPHQGYYYCSRLYYCYISWDWNS